MNSDKWDYNTTSKFIRLVHTRPTVWREGFNDLNARDAAIKEISERLNITPFKIRQKLKAMKVACIKEHQRMKAFNDFKPQWPYYHQYRFVLNNKHLQGNKPKKPEEILWVEDENKQNELYDESAMNDFEHCLPNEQQNMMELIDKYTIWGENIANELRSLENCKVLQTKLKNKITIAMIEAFDDIAKQS